MKKMCKEDKFKHVEEEREEVKVESANGCISNARKPSIQQQKGGLAINWTFLLILTSLLTCVQDRITKMYFLLTL
jgi:hypothetical protein